MTFHNGRPAVNVKIQGSGYDVRDRGMRDFRAAQPDADPRFTWDWIDEHSRMEWDVTLEDGWRTLQTRTNDDRIFGRYVDVYPDGRSNGWAYVQQVTEPCDCTREQWAAFEQLCDDVVSDIPYQYVSAVYANWFEPWAERTELFETAARRVYA